MLGSSGEDEHSPTLQEFYNGKSVFVTGAAGFIGSILLETLLRCFPGIKSIYILLRPKKNVQPEVRKGQIFKKKIFERINEKTPELIQKIHVIPGEASLPNLGMSKEDVQLLIAEVSVVFHCAAVINFTKPLMFTLINNVLSLNSIIELCKQMRKFKALVYTSTAYSNSNRPTSLFKEEVYRLPFHAERFLNVLKNEDYKELEELVAYCKPEWPNTYTFSKSLAENVIMDTASDLQVAIIRPSVVACTYKKPMPGYAEGRSGMGAMLLGAGKGFIKVMNIDPNSKLNLVPADTVANAHVVAAWSVGTKRCKSPLVVNCTATSNTDIKMTEFRKIMTDVALKYPLPQSFDVVPSLSLVPNKYLYYIVVAYKHYLPAIVLDGILRVLGKKPRIFSLYRFLDTVMGSLRFFMFYTFEFERSNMEYIDKLIPSEDRKNLSLDFRDASIAETAHAIPTATEYFDWKIDRRSQLERQKITYRRHLLISCIQWMFLMTCCFIIYSVFSFFF